MLNPYQKSKIITSFSPKFQDKEKPVCNIILLYQRLTGNTVSTRKTGKAVLALCPFHKERNPSFAMYPKTNSYYCFSCSATGDIYKMVMELENVDFKQALEIIKRI